MILFPKACNLKPQTHCPGSAAGLAYGLAGGANDGRSVILDYAPEVNLSDEVGCDPWSRDKLCHPQSWDGLLGFIRSVTLVQPSLRPSAALEHP